MNYWRSEVNVGGPHPTEATIEWLYVLSKFYEDKSPGSDKITMEFYFQFYDLIRKEISEVVDESKRVRVHGSLTSTYITLIPKKDKLETFNDYRPISLSNILYKIITKIIVERLKPYMGKFISENQFGFLPNKQLLDAVGLYPTKLYSCIHCGD